jgi:hypothetical protein
VHEAFINQEEHTRTWFVLKFMVNLIPWRLKNEKRSHLVGAKSIVGLAGVTPEYDN